MDDCRTQNTNYKYRSGPLSSFTVVTPHFILPKLLRGTQNQWVAHVSFVIIYSTGLTPFPWLSAPPHLSHSHLMGSGTLERCFLHGWMVAVGLWYGQAYIMDNEHRYILLMAFWMHRDTVTRSWGPYLCHSSTTITSCCSMIMHGPMLQGSVHNSWKLKSSQFLHGQHTHRTCHPLSMFGMLWIGVYVSLFQFLPKSINFAQPLKRSGPTFHRPQSTTWSTLTQITNTDLDRFVNNIWEKWVFCSHGKSLRSLRSAHEKWGEKSVAFIILFSVLI